MSVDDDLLLNRILDRYGEQMRHSMKPEIRDRFDALPVDSRRSLIQKQINKTARDDL